MLPMSCYVCTLHCSYQHLWLTIATFSFVTENITTEHTVTRQLTQTDRRPSGCIRNQQSERTDLSDEIDLVRWKRTPLSDFITVTHYYTIISHNSSDLSPYDWPFWTGYWNAYVTCVMGVAYKNLAVSCHSDFSQMHPSRSRFDCEGI